MWLNITPESATSGCCKRPAGLCMADSLLLRALLLVPSDFRIATDRGSACMMKK